MSSFFHYKPVSVCEMMQLTHHHVVVQLLLNLLLYHLFVYYFSTKLNSMRIKLRKTPQIMYLINAIVALPIATAVDDKVHMKSTIFPLNLGVQKRNAMRASGHCIAF